MNSKVKGKMDSKLLLTLYKSDRGVVVGDIWLREKGEVGTRLIGSSNPAIISAAMFSMGESDFVFGSGSGRGQFKFPIDCNEICRLCSLLANEDEADFISAFSTYSRVDYAHPKIWDSDAEVMWRVACHYLPQYLIKMLPGEPAPRAFKQDLIKQNKFIFFPEF